MSILDWLLSSGWLLVSLDVASNVGGEGALGGLGAGAAAAGANARENDAQRKEREQQQKDWEDYQRMRDQFFDWYRNEATSGKQSTQSVVDTAENATEALKTHPGRHGPPERTAKALKDVLDFADAMNNK